MIQQCDGAFIFYQTLTFDCFYEFLEKYEKEVFFNKLVKVIKDIIKSFVENCKKNPLLPLEIIF